MLLDPVNYENKKVYSPVFDNSAQMKNIFPECWNSAVSYSDATIWFICYISCLTPKKQKIHHQT